MKTTFKHNHRTISRERRGRKANVLTFITDYMSDTELSTRAEHGGKPVDGMHYVKKKNKTEFITIYSPHHYNFNQTLCSWSGTIKELKINP